ncbi:MAG: tetratricopeptide repeat protein [Sulfuriferula sp.]
MKRTSLLALLFLAITSHAGLSLAAPNPEYQEISNLFKQGQYDNALTRVNAYLVKNPQDAQARFLKGIILTEQNKSTDAIKVFTGLTEDFPELPEPYNNLAVLYASQGQYDKAKNALEMAIRTHPSYATAHENLGDIYAKMASQAYDKALQLDSRNATAQTKLALIKDLFGSRKGSIMVASTAKPATPATSAVKPTAPPTVVTPSKPADTKPGVTVVANSDITSAVQAWADAWANQNVEAYLAGYAPKFKTPNDEPRSDWETTRRERISTPKKIVVVLSDINVTNVTNDTASVSFKQMYQSDRLKSNARKTLTLVKTNGKWLITEENSR